MVIKNIKIVTPTKVIENGYIEIENGLIKSVNEGEYKGEAIDGNGKIAMPGFVDVHIHGSMGIDFMDANKDDYKVISKALYSEGVTTYLATTLTSDHESMLRVCKVVKDAIKENPSLGGIHFEGPYISAKHKGAQNEAFIRDPSIDELKQYIKESENNIRYIAMAPEKNGALDFIKYATTHGVVVAAGHSDATMDDMAKAIEAGLTNVTHTHNAQSGYHHRNPGIVTSAMYFDSLNCEVISDMIHVCPNTIKTFYKIVGADRFMIISDALKIKHSNIDKFELFGLPCIRKNGAAYLEAGPLAGSLLTLDQGIRNIRDITGAGLVELAKISSTNAAKSLNFKDRGSLEVGKLADIVLMDNDLFVKDVYKLGEKVY